MFEFDIFYIIFVLLWAVINYAIVKAVVKKVNEFYANPMLYAIGAILFGGIYPLLFFVIKYLYWYNKYGKKDKGGK